MYCSLKSEKGLMIFFSYDYFFEYLFYHEIHYRRLLGDRQKMLFKLPQFEIKTIIDNNWKKVSEKEFLIRLVDTFEAITPLLSEMFKGEKISTQDCSFRIHSVRF